MLDERSLKGFARLGALARARSAAPVERPEFHLLPDNVPVFQLWGEVQSQWAHGPMGPTGFNWHSLRAHPAVRRVPAAQREDLLQGVADMESAWLGARAAVLKARADEADLRR